MNNVEYTAQVHSSVITGEAKMSIGTTSFTVSSALDIIEIPYFEVNAIGFANYAVTISTDSGLLKFERMGEWAERFFTALRDKYNEAVLRSMFLKGKPLVTATGGYRYSESGTTGGGEKVPMQVYNDCIAALPTDLGARRIPLCFVSCPEGGMAINKGDYALTLKLDMGESYTFSKLGYDTNPIVETIEKQIRALREKSFGLIKGIDPAMSTVQCSQLSKLMPEGAAAQTKQIAQIAPGFLQTLDREISQSKNGEYFTELKEVCSIDRMYIGIKEASNSQFTAAPAETLHNSQLPGQGDILFWLIAPSPDGTKAIVEFFEENTATFIYKVNGSFDVFAKQLSRALEAIDFKREVIRMTDEQLKQSENADYFMASKRTAALRFIRSSYADRVIHSGVDGWKRGLLL